MFFAQAEIGGSAVYLTQSFQQVERLPLYRYQLNLRLARALDLAKASDAAGRSQRFAIEVVAHRDRRTRRAIASGQDIYTVTAPLVVEAMERIVEGRCRTLGATTAGETFDAPDFLAALAPEHLLIGAPILDTDRRLSCASASRDSTALFMTLTQPPVSASGRVP